MIGVPSQGQAMLAGQGAAGFFALLNGNVGGNAAPSSTPFGALLAQLHGMNGQPAMAATGVLEGLSNLSSNGLELSPELAFMGNLGIHTIPADMLAALSDLKNSLGANFALDGITAAGQQPDGQLIDFAAANDGDLAAAALPFLAGLIATLPQPTAAPTLATAETPDKTASKSDTSGALPPGIAKLLAPLAASLEPAAGNGNEESSLPAPQPLADNPSAKTAPADAISAAHDLGIAGIELARIAGGRALAKGMSMVPESSTLAPDLEQLGSGLELDLSGLATDDSMLRAAAAIKAVRQGGLLPSQNTEASALSAPLNTLSIATAENPAAAVLRALAMNNGKASASEAMDLLSPLSDTATTTGGLSDAPLTPGPLLSQLNARGPSALNLSAPLANHVATQVAVHIGHALRDGQNEFKIRLDPPELGRIDVKLEMHQDGRVSAILAADNEQTLQLFERHHGLLERALQEAGLKADAGSLSFTLSGGGKEAKSGLADHGNGNANNPAADDVETTDDVVAVATLNDRALDIRV